MVDGGGWWMVVCKRTVLLQCMYGGSTNIDGKINYNKVL